MQPAQQKRSREKKAMILMAARSVLITEGTRAVSHRRVAEKAGVPTGSVAYYFSNREMLLRESLLIEEEERSAVARKVRETAGPHLQTIEVGKCIVWTIWGDDEVNLAGRVWAFMDSVRESEGLRNQQRKAREALDADLQELLVRCGYPATYVDLVLANANGSVVSSSIEGHTSKAFEIAAQESANLLDKLGRK